MINIDKAKTYGWEEAIRGMRNPMNSWDKSDSIPCYARMHCLRFPCSNHGARFCIGDNDIKLMKRLVKAGTDHRKFMRMIVVYCDITAPMYWWKEFDTYKVGTVRNSCSTIHKIQDKVFEFDDFSIGHLTAKSRVYLENLINRLNECRKEFLSTGDKEQWWQMIQLLPSSYNQKSTVMLNYEVLSNMYHSRKNHKLDEWKDFCKWIETLPYSELIIEKGIQNGNN